MKQRIILFLKGMAMGGADVIPGVSGGTVALISGIYEELIGSIRAVDLIALKLIISGQFKAFWQRINGAFLINVFAGVAVSIFSLAKLITWLLATHPIPVWSFFFGLILVSAFYVIPKERSWLNYSMVAVGAILAYVVTALSPANTPEALWFVFLSGAIAICAMILPGISGSFILLLLGKYEFILGAVKSLDLVIIAVFVLGCLLGIILFSKVIHWLLSHYHTATLATLAGFMLGSLNKIWPWKIEEGVTFVNIDPFTYAEKFGVSSQLYLAIGACFFGVILIFLLEKIGAQLQKK